MEIGMERTLVIITPALLYAGDLDYRSLAPMQVCNALAAVGPSFREVNIGIYSSTIWREPRYFGGEESFAAAAKQAVEDATRDNGVGTTAGVADGMVAALLAACMAVGNGTIVVPQGETPDFLAPLPVHILTGCALHPDILGIDTFGDLARLPEKDVLNRFGRNILYCRQIATGKQGKLTPTIYDSIMKWLAVCLQDGKEPFSAKEHDPGIASRPDGVASKRHGIPNRWSEPPSQQDGQACIAIYDVYRSMGYGSVSMGKLHGGRYPAERAEQIAWTPKEMSSHVPGWHEPGQISLGKTENAVDAGKKNLQLDTSHVAPPAGYVNGQGRSGIGFIGKPEVWLDCAANAGPPSSMDMPEVWSGYLPGPSPVVLYRNPTPVAVRDRKGERVRVYSNGEVSGEPYLLVIGRNAQVWISSWAGPWVFEGRWWERNAYGSHRCHSTGACSTHSTGNHAAKSAGHRSQGKYGMQGIQSTRTQNAYSALRQARIQVVTVSGIGYLLLEEGGYWYMEATYD